MLKAAEEAIDFARDKSENHFQQDRMLQLALIQCIQIIGEAAGRVSPKARSLAPQLPWTQIVGMRHILVHVYFEIDLPTVWKAVQEDLPSLVSILRQVLDSWSRSDR